MDIIINNSLQKKIYVVTFLYEYSFIYLYIFTYLYIEREGDVLSLETRVGPLEEPDIFENAAF